MTKRSLSKEQLLPLVVGFLQNSPEVRSPQEIADYVLANLRDTVSARVRSILDVGTALRAFVEVDGCYAVCGPLPMLDAVVDNCFCRRRRYCKHYSRQRKRKLGNYEEVIREMYEERRLYQ
ncbi:unnamed protein product [Nezara viridula]|uniref:Uncharacterized protein n=1 Tax=Nezara viridula TaxID=85310 RepID=A0A9P0H6K1_NEZVI|nr:unnamed protein product [Nezara viridula]